MLHGKNTAVIRSGTPASLTTTTTSTSDVDSGWSSDSEGGKIGSGSKGLLGYLARLLRSANLSQTSTAHGGRRTNSKPSHSANGNANGHLHHHPHQQQQQHQHGRRPSRAWQVFVFMLVACVGFATVRLPFAARFSLGSKEQRRAMLGFLGGSRFIANSVHWKSIPSGRGRPTYSSSSSLPFQNQQQLGTNLQHPSQSSSISSIGGGGGQMTTTSVCTDPSMQQTVLDKPEYVRCAIVRPDELRAALAGMQAGRPVAATISNLAFKDMLRNWHHHVVHVARIPNVLVGALDEQTHVFCGENGIASLLLHSSLTSADFRRNGTLFQDMGMAKTAFVAAVLEAGWDLLMSDNDVVWLRDPFDVVKASSPLGAADVMVSSDSVSYTNDVKSQEADSMQLVRRDSQGWFRFATPRAQEFLGNEYEHAFNTGILFLRATPITVTFVLTWHEVMRTRGASQGWDRIWGDQHVFNQLHRLKMFPIKVVNPPDGSRRNNRVFWTFNNTLHLAILPVGEFCNGHTFFVQNVPARFHTQPYVVHSTFQYYFGDGKKARFREAGLWAIDPPEYYKDGNFLSLEMELPRAIVDMEPGLKRHAAALQFYYIGLQNALAIAHTLGRTLIMPNVTCFCDRWWDSLWPPCRAPGGDIDPPFKCPLDHFVDVGWWETSDSKQQSSPQPSSKLPKYRPSNFLEDPRTHPSIPSSRVVVGVEGVAASSLSSSSSSSSTASSSASLHSRPVDVMLPALASEVEVAAVLASSQSARVIHLVNPLQSFCRFSSPASAEAFDNYTHHHFLLKWCCTPGRRFFNITVPPMVNRTLHWCGGGGGSSSSSSSTNKSNTGSSSSSSSPPSDATMATLLIAGLAASFENATHPKVAAPAVSPWCTPTLNASDTPRWDPEVRKKIVVAEELNAALSGMVKGKPVIGTISNLAFKQMLVNWHHHVVQADMEQNMLIGALDKETVEFGKQHGMRMLLLHSTLPTGDFRGNPEMFKRMGMMKTAFVLSVLEAGWDLLLSDIDNVWLRDPSAFFHASSPLGAADVMVTSDSVSHSNDVKSMEVDSKVRVNNSVHGWFLTATPRANEIFGNAYEHAFNTGVLFLRSTPATIEFVKAWHDVMRTNATAPVWDRSWGCLWGDQHGFNQLHRLQMFPIQIVDPPDGGKRNNRIFWTFGHKVKLAILPIAKFCNGHVFFVQRVPQRMQMQPYVVHNTFQFHQFAGKVTRFRQHNMWASDPPEFFEEGNFVSLEIHLPQQILDMPMSIDKHIAALRYYYECTQNALAIARITNRFLILPTVTCFCDRWWFNMTAPCRAPGVDVDPPYECPMDHWVDPFWWGALSPGLKYRPSNFLTHPRVSPSIAASRLDVGVESGEGSGGSGSATVRLPQHATEVDVARVLFPYNSTRVIHLTQPFLSFCRFTTEDANKAFDKYAYKHFHLDWCCTLMKEYRTVSIANLTARATAGCPGGGHAALVSSSR